jgi:hypothetical protein
LPEKKSVAEDVEAAAARLMENLREVLNVLGTKAPVRTNLSLGLVAGCVRARAFRARGFLDLLRERVVSIVV